MSVLTINEIKEKVAPIAKKYHFKAVFLFGSYARGQAREDSDVDLAFESNEVLSYFDIFKIETELENVLGKEVDLAPLVQLSEARTPIAQYMFENKVQKEMRLIS